MALTLTVVKRVAMPAGKGIVVDVTFDSSYPTGGNSLLPSDLGLKTIELVDVAQKAAASRIVAYDYANSKLMLFTALSTEAANLSNQSAIVVRAFIVGDSIGLSI